MNGMNNINLQTNVKEEIILNLENQNLSKEIVL